MTQPRYETLELVVPPPQPRPRRVPSTGRTATRDRRVEAFWLVIVGLIGVFIGYTLATPRTGQGPASTAPALSGAPLHTMLVDRHRERGAFNRAVERTDARAEMASGVTPRPALTFLSGYATWYDVAPGNAAAGPDLRAWLGDWRGQTVKVCHGGCVLVALTDWCACADRSGRPTLVDLSKSDFAVIGDPSAGVISVTVSRGGAVALPATDTAP